MNLTLSKYKYKKINLTKKALAGLSIKKITKLYCQTPEQI